MNKFYFKIHKQTNDDYKLYNKNSFNGLLLQIFIFFLIIIIDIFLIKI